MAYNMTILILLHITNITLSIVAIALALVAIAARAPRDETLGDTIKTVAKETTSKARETIKPQRAQVISPTERQRHDLSDL